MPSFPWKARKDVSPAEDTSYEALLGGNEPPAGARPELQAVADVLAALTARPRGQELTGLAAAQREFRSHVAAPAQARPARGWRSVGLVSRLGARFCAAAAIVVMGFGGAAAAAYAGALPTSWQQFAHRTIGAPVHATVRDTRATTKAARSPAPPKSRHPAHPPHARGPRARYGFHHHTWPRRHAPLPTPQPSPLLPTPRPTVRRVVPSPSPAAGQWPIPTPTPAEPVASPDPTVSNAGGVRDVS
jgi:hypothetical protein